jgi:hypothetical protein
MIRSLRKIIKYLLLLMIALIVAGALYGWVLISQSSEHLRAEDHAHAADVHGDSGRRSSTTVVLHPFLRRGWIMRSNSTTKATCKR